MLARLFGDHKTRCYFVLRAPSNPKGTSIFIARIDDRRALVPVFIKSKIKTRRGKRARKRPRDGEKSRRVNYPTNGGFRRCELLNPTYVLCFSKFVLFFRVLIRFCEPNARSGSEAVRGFGIEVFGKCFDVMCCFFIFVF